VNGLSTSPPPPDAEELNAWILETAAQLRGLRADLVEALNVHASVMNSELDGIPDRMVLVVTELATNAIKHGHPPTLIRLLRTEDQFVLDVADHDLTAFPELAETRPINAGGRGLHLAQAFALEVGWYATDDTKHIWAVFPIDADS
jgi:serine/threonine-protein kinase RsbW